MAGALLRVLTDGRLGQTYNIGGRSEKTNLEVVKRLCTELDDLVPSPAGPYQRLMRFVADRPGHDRRYAIDDTRIAQELGWRPQHIFETGLKETIEWYLGNSEWVERVKTGAYRQWMQSNYADRGAAQ